MPPEKKRYHQPRRRRRYAPSQVPGSPQILRPGLRRPATWTYFAPGFAARPSAASSTRWMPSAQLPTNIQTFPSASSTNGSIVFWIFTAGPFTTSAAYSKGPVGESETSASTRQSKSLMKSEM